MKQSLFVFSLLSIVLLHVSCGGKKQSQIPSVSSYDDWEEYEDINRDSTIYGICLDGSAMHSLELMTDNGDTLLLDVQLAKENGNLLGGYTIGDRIAVIANRQRTSATMVINLTMLLGEWVMQNPLDGTSEIGISIRDGGIAESINQNSMSYQTWRIVNGKLELMGVREESGNFEETDLYQIKRLTVDSLVFENADELLEFAHPGKGEDYSDIPLDDDNVSDAMI
jgi:hypothetical protein